MQVTGIPVTSLGGTHTRTHDGYGFEATGTGIFAGFAGICESITKHDISLISQWFLEILEPYANIDCDLCSLRTTTNINSN